MQDAGILVLCLFFFFLMIRRPPRSTPFPTRRSSDLFTGTTNSQCPSLRQRPNRYAIRAGRNLPDKEFRYLRTVIVTAAVYRGFDSELAPLLLTFRHRAGVRPYTSSCAKTGPPSPEVTGAFCRVPSTPFSQAPWYALPVHQCRFGVRSLMPALFPGSPQAAPPIQ